jgi:hypothetical protein
MDPYRTYGQEDQQTLPDGDALWNGVNLKDAAHTLPAGLAAEGVNLRFTDGHPEPRKGCRLIGWANRRDTADPGKILSYAAARGIARFTSPVTGQDWLLIAAGGYVWRTRQGMAPVKVPIPDGTAFTERVNLVQAFNVVIMMRGENQDRLIMEDIGEGFKTVPNPSPHLTQIPNSTTALVFQNRLLVPYDRDLVAVSDVLDYMYFDSARNTFRINRGTDDSLVGLYKFNDTTVLAFKERSVYAISGLTPDSAGAYPGAVLDEITREYGCRSVKSMVAVGSDVWFMADQRGMVSITQTLSNKLQGVDVPKSRNVEPIIKEINWNCPEAVCCAYWDNRVYVAIRRGETLQGTELNNGGTFAFGFGVVTVTAGQNYRWIKGGHEISIYFGAGTLTDSGTFIPTLGYVVIRGIPGSSYTFSLQQEFLSFADTVLVYDCQRGEWSGYDESDAIKIHDWVKVNYGGQERLAFLSTDGYVYLYEDGFRDALADAAGAVSFREIQWNLVTRGYHGGLDGNKKFTRLDSQAETWRPRYTVAARYPGVRGEENVSAGEITTDRQQYYRPFDARPYDTTNINNDFHAPDRQDYSVLAQNAQYVGPGGLSPDRHQIRPQGFRLRGSAPYVQIAVRGQQGRARILSLSVRARPAGRRTGVL